MKFEDFVGEYVSSGLILLLSILLVLSDCGFLPPFLGFSGLAGTPIPTGTILSIPGALVFFVLISISYPVGYNLFRYSLVLMNRVGRKEIYDHATQLLRVRPYKDYLLDVSRLVGNGYAAASGFEKDFAIIRMHLFVNHPSIFGSIQLYWTRLGRMFACYALAFLLSGLVFLVGCASFFFFNRSSQVQHWYLALVGITLLSSAASVSAYKKVLNREIEIFVSAMRSIWLNDPCKRGFVFAYGSNMLNARIGARIDSASKFCNAYLANHALIFNKRGADGSAKANVIEKEGSHVAGVLYEIKLPHLTELDQAEPNYERVQMKVRTDTGSEVMAEVYFARAEVVDTRIQPFSWYIALMRAGAIENALGSKYINELDMIECTHDLDTHRVQYNERILNSNGINR
ncbi:MAG: gamma-glutamylcyclotransferase family protein [Rhodoferax sp.]|uniref:gamma-glutamylcyclotransferase family protein n=1 Tax=Rhodoferax sp. TaxID=50421 RepID=UPI003264381A